MSSGLAFHKFKYWKWLSYNLERDSGNMMYGIYSLLCQLDLGEWDQDKDSNMLTNNVIAIDLAKNVLQACHISVHGELLSNKPLSRQKMKEFLAKAKPSIVGKRTKLISNKYWVTDHDYSLQIEFIKPDQKLWESSWGVGEILDAQCD